MAKALKLICGLKNRPAWLIALAIALLLLLYLLRAWLWGLFVLYLGALVLLGLLAGMRLAQGLLRRLCWKLDATPKGSDQKDNLHRTACTYQSTPTNDPTR